MKIPSIDLAKTYKLNIYFYNGGNYICVDSQKCNQNITSLDKLHHFIEVKLKFFIDFEKEEKWLEDGKERIPIFSKY